MHGSTQITDYGYDELNRLESVTDASGTTTYGYDAVGNRTSVSYPNGTSQVYRYNNLNRLITLETYGVNGALVEQYDYTLNATGRRTFIDELDGLSSAYEYDLLNRLTKETISGDVQNNRTTQYTYDKVGNRLSETIDGVTTSFTYDHNDRLQSSNNASYVYDDNGNTFSATEAGVITTYAYNAKNQLSSATNTAGTTQFAYNVDGIRTQKINGNAITHFVVDSNQGYAQVLNEITGTNRTVYTYGDDLISQRSNNQTHFYHYDGLGSTRQLSNQSGSFTDSYDYQAFGDILNQTGTTQNNYLFTGEQFDQTLNQYYLRARYYNQQTGRFTQQDSWMGNSQDPITLHKYLYANVDPVGMVDPSGNMPLSEVGAAIKVQTILAIQNVIRFSRAGSSVLGKAIKSTALFSIGTIVKTEVRKCYRSKGKNCALSNIVVIGDQLHPESQRHIQDALVGNDSNGAPISPLVEYSKGANRDRSWMYKTPECEGKTGGITKMDCDEFPYATTKAGGKSGYYNYRVSLRPVSSNDNQDSGRVWGRAVVQGKNGTKYLIIPFGPVSFYFSNGKFGL